MVRQSQPRKAEQPPKAGPSPSSDDLLLVPGAKKIGSERVPDRPITELMQSYRGWWNLPRPKPRREAGVRNHPL